MLAYLKSFVYEKFNLCNPSCVKHDVELPVIKYTTRTVNKFRMEPYSYYSMGRLLTGYKYVSYLDTENVQIPSNETVRAAYYTIKDDKGRWCFSIDDLIVKNNTIVTSILCSYLMFERDGHKTYNILGILSLLSKILAPSIFLCYYKK
jgi:hypothetical protein